MLKDSLWNFKLGSSKCDAENANGTYCDRWSYSELKYRKCFSVLVYYTDTNGVTQSRYDTVCCSKGNKAQYACCNSICSTSTYNVYQPSSKYSACHCVEPSVNGKFCASWQCEEYETISQSFATGRKYENYTCVTSGASPASGGLLNTNAVDGEFCAAWNGSVESRSKFELSQCSCTATTAHGSHGHCASWECTERSVDYYWPNPLWIIFAILMGGLPLAVGLVFYDRYMRREEASHPYQVKALCELWKDWPFRFVWLAFFLWTCSMSVISFWKTGFITVYFTASAFVVVLIVTCRLHVLPYCAWKCPHGDGVVQPGVAPHHPLEPPLEPVQWELSAAAPLPSNGDMEQGTSATPPIADQSVAKALYQPLSSASVVAAEVMAVVACDDAVAVGAVPTAAAVGGPSNDTSLGLPHIHADQAEELRHWKGLYEQGLIVYDLYQAEVERVLRRRN